MKPLTGLFLLFFLTGCSLHEPAQVELPVNPPAKYLSAKAGTVSGDDYAQWWLTFEDEKLNLLMEELFTKNLELTQAYAKLAQVESAFRVTHSGQSPNVAVGGEAKRSRQPGLVEDFTGSSQQLSVAAGYEIDLWGKLAAQTQAAELDYLATYLDTQTLYLGLSARFADLYFVAVEQRAQLALTEQTIRSYADTAARVESRYRLGLAPAVEMYQARQSLSGASAASYLYEARLAEAEHAMAVLLGRYPEAEPGKGLEQLPDVTSLLSTGVPAELISRRPDLQAAMKRIEAADARVAGAIADRFPSLSLTGSVGSLRQDVTAGLLKGEFWSLLGNLTLPIIDGGRRRAEVDRREAQLAEAVANYQQKVLEAFREVEDALMNNKATRLRVERLAETATATDATLRLSTNNYLGGLTDYLPVLSAQRADFDAKSRLLAAKRQLLADRISLARALGGGWMVERVNSRVTLEKDKKE